MWSECELEYFLSGAQQVDTMVLQRNEDAALRSTVLVDGHGTSIEDAHKVALLQSANPDTAGLCGDLDLVVTVLDSCHRQSCRVVQLRGQQFQDITVIVTRNIGDERMPYVHHQSIRSRCP